MTASVIVNIILVVICSFWAGMNTGHLLTLWQEDAKNRNDERKDRDDEI